MYIKLWRICLSLSFLLFLCIPLVSSIESSIEQDVVQSIVEDESDTHSPTNGNDYSINGDVVFSDLGDVKEELLANIVDLDQQPETPAATLSIPKTTLKSPVKTGDASQAKDDMRHAKPTTNSGSYYGNNQGHTNRPAPQAKKSPERMVSKPKVRMGGQPLSEAQDLEERLSHELRQSRSVKDGQDRLKSRAMAASNARATRFKIARKYAYPVEHILEIYNDPSTDLYDVLGVKDTIKDGDLRKVYHHRAKEVHPDKNSHPDAQLAFDALQDAYNTLSHASRRSEYDQERRRKIALARARRFSSRRMRKYFADQAENWKSALQLLHFELVFTETDQGIRRNTVGTILYLLWNRVKNIVKDKSAAAKEALHRNIEHYVLLPSVADRLQLLQEQLWRYKYNLFAVLLVVGFTRRFSV